jgi:hypothetical protein
MRRLLCWVCLSATFALTAQSQTPNVDIDELEARLAYEAAVDLADGGDIHAATRRLEWVIARGNAPEWTARARAKLPELEQLRDAPEPMSGTTRAGLVTFGTVFTTWLAVGSLIVADAESESLAGIALIGGPLVGLSYSVSATRDSKLSDGQASLVNLGGMWGIWQGTGSAVVAGLSDKATVFASMAGGLAGLGAARAIVEDRPVSAGDASLITAAATWGTWLTLCGAMASDIDDTDAIVIGSMLGGDAALVGAALSAPSVGMSRSRVRLINAAGLVGALYGWGATVLGEMDSDRGRWSALGVGSIAGLATGAYLTRNMDDDGDASDFFLQDLTSDASSGSSMNGLAVGPERVTYSMSF